jgi:nitrile hydratase
MSVRFSDGERVRVRAAHPPGHVRTPYFARGKEGVVMGLAAVMANAETLAYGADGKPDIPIYRVQFAQTDLWPDYSGEARDTAVLDIYEHWLEPATGQETGRETGKETGSEK